MAFCRPREVRWKWNSNKHQNSIWIGDVNAGLRYQLKGPNYVRPLVNIYYKYKKLNRLYADVKVIHIILDNYVIHTSKITQKAVEKFNGKIVLHFLPPYCPDDNKIERCVWRELHANVTRNHKCRNMNELMHEFVAISQSEIEQ